MNFPFIKKPSAKDDFLSAVAQDRMTYVVQPISCALDNTLELYGECLVRMVNREGRLVAPDAFIPQLEAAGNISLLDEHMITLALSHLNQTERGALGCNISVDTIQDNNAWNSVYKIIAENSHLADRLIIEITETRPIAHIDAFIENLAQARSLGCRIAVDDFGDGYMSPAMLLRLEVDIVKIDKSLLRNIRSSGQNHSSLHHIIGFAKAVAPLVVVEGVEDARDLIRSAAAGATHVQGYFICKPRPKGFLPEHSPIDPIRQSLLF
ncbi:EAL domain-containing protein [Agrobacterium sp. O3.4]|uniref:EAL domain-containing protein n=1 Tax=Agrobacterium cucumeris TaxID=2862866 RepID=A0ABY8RRE9_9HYPH|nr:MULTISPECIES: EAL domain-containing protein [Rhizobium/Agrobacterium group]MCZ7469143.1 EAL domain-containing protein [Rhizobium rhizogenes]WHO10165.1 EAL domain-containing protein [Agrobacterium cucumeris]